MITVERDHRREDFVGREDSVAEVPAPRPPTITAEHALRRADFCGGTPVRLKDGQEWYFAEPSITITSVPGMYFPVTYPCLELSGDRETSAYLNAGLLKHPSINRAPAVLFFDAREFAAEAAAAMLLRNYDLPPARLRDLLFPTFNPAITAAIYEAAFDRPMRMLLDAFRDMPGGTPLAAAADHPASLTVAGA